MKRINFVLIAIILIFISCSESGNYGSGSDWTCYHHWDWEVLKEPTTTEAGEEIYSCYRCGEINNTRKVIAYVDIGVGIPINGETPNTTAFTTNVGYTLSDVTWSPDDNMFRGDTYYSAEVTLTADTGYVFYREIYASINDRYTEVLYNTESTITLTCYFVTSSKVVTDIELKSQPDKMSYIHGDMLDLSGLAVTFIYDDFTTEDVNNYYFNYRSINVNPASNTRLVHSTHNNQPIIIAYGSLESLNTSDLTVNPKVMNFTVDAISAQTYNRNALTPTITVRDGTTILTPTTDYIVEYANNINSGTASVTVIGTGNYAGSTGSRTFTINPRIISLTVDAVPAQTCTGIALTPTVTVKDGSNILTQTIDYTAIYSNNINAGTATITVTGVGNYNGSTGSRTFTINKGIGVNVNTPTINGTPSYNRILLNVVTTPNNGQNVEYARNTNDSVPSTGWQDSTIFTGLSPSTTYYIFARSKENYNFNASQPNEGLQVTTRTPEIYPSGYIFSVTNSDQWEDAIFSIGYGGNSKTYTINVNENIITYGFNASIGAIGSLSSADATFGGATSITVTITGNGKISLQTGTTGSLLNINTGQIVTINNVTFGGHNSNNRSLVNVYAGGRLTMQGDASVSNNTNRVTNDVAAGGGISVTGTLIMRGNSTVTGNTVSGSGSAPSSVGGGVYARGIVEMYDNASVTNNNSSSGGGVFIYSSTTTMNGYSSVVNNRAGTGGGVTVAGSGTDRGTFKMLENSSVSGNTATGLNTNTTPMYGGGGVSIYNGIFEMRDNSIISGNTANSTGADAGGGGLYINGGSILKVGGIIYGSNATVNLRNTASSNSGHACYSPGGALSTSRWRNNTAGLDIMHHSEASWWEN